MSKVAKMVPNDWYNILDQLGPFWAYLHSMTKIHFHLKNIVLLDQSALEQKNKVLSEMVHKG